MHGKMCIQERLTCQPTTVHVIHVLKVILNPLLSGKIERTSIIYSLVTVAQHFLSLLVSVVVECVRVMIPTYIL